MDLKDFISKTVSEIIAGLDKASKTTNKDVGLYSMGESNRRHIEFDVAVTVGNKKETAGGLGIKVLSMIQATGKN